MEEMEFIDNAVPHDKKGSTWEMTLRGTGVRYVQIGNIFTGLYVPVKENTRTIKEIVRFPDSLSKNSNKRRTWRDNPYLLKRQKMFAKHLAEARVGTVVESDRLIVTGRNKLLDELMATRSTKAATTSAEQYDQDEPELENVLPQSSEPAIATTIGPQVDMLKSRCNFHVPIGQTADCDVEVRNVGTTAIYFELRKIEKPNLLPHVTVDNTQRFFCHAVKGVLLPGQSKSFKFSFLSSIPGVFTEIWSLFTSPGLLHPIDDLVLHGTATVEDENVDKRRRFDDELSLKDAMHTVEEIIGDLLERVRTPTPPPFDLTDSKICEELFEFRNAHRQLFYWPYWFGKFQELYEDLRSVRPPPPASTVTAETLQRMTRKKREEYEREQKRKEIEDNEWNLTVDQLESIIQTLQDEEVKEQFKTRLRLLVRRSLVKPTHKSPFYDAAFEVLLELAEKIPDISGSIRQSLNMPQKDFVVPLQDPEDPLRTENSTAAPSSPDPVPAATGKPLPAAATASKKAEAPKKEVGKKSEEAARKEEEQRVEQERQYREQFRTQITTEFLSVVDRFEMLCDETKLLARELARQTLTNDHFDALKRTMTVEDVDLEDKRVLVRVDWDMPLEQDGSSYRITDQSKFNESLTTIQHCVSQAPRTLVIMAHLGQPHGVEVPGLSLAPIVEMLAAELQKKVVLLSSWQDEHAATNIEQMPEGTIVVLENLCFNAEEEGFGELEDGTLIRPTVEQIDSYCQHLARLGDIYVNEAFHHSHRMYNSMIGLDVPLKVCGTALKSHLNRLAEEFADPASYTNVQPYADFEINADGTEAPEKETEDGVVSSGVSQADVALLSGAKLPGLLVLSVRAPDILDLSQNEEYDPLLDSDPYQ
eukprot:GILJ01003647.1.p1 GENE.GILJ01003647.1~~GILJ01003647.1.p1  ORF type:complete len:975 (-),score=186.14 GILJ01003647.1:142-2760(-)